MSEAESADEAAGPAATIVASIVKAQGQTARPLTRFERLALERAAAKIDAAVGRLLAVQALDVAALEEKIALAVDRAIETRLEAITAPPSQPAGSPKKGGGK